MRRFIIISFVGMALLLAGCPRVALNGPNLQAHVQAQQDFVAESLPLLEQQLAAAQGTQECQEVASLVIYARHWADYNAKALLASSNPALGDDPGEVPVIVDTPMTLCPEVE